MLDVVNPLQKTSYTNKDFLSIYPELLDLVKELTATWDPSISNESDPGVVLLKLNALIADKLSYNSDTNVLELFPLSVTQEKNARQLFEQLGYYMHWYKGAITDISIAWIGAKEKNKSYTIEPFSIVSDYNNSITYTLIGPSDGNTLNTYKVGEQLLPLDGSAISFKAIQGVPVTYTINGEDLITVSNLDSNNRLYFPTTDVAENGIFITNVNANNYTDWKKVDNLLIQPVSAESLNYKFGVSQNTTTCYLEFPENAEEIFKNGINITYIKTLGETGNISYGIIEKFYNEISPKEDSSVIFTLDNIKILNYIAAINGKDPQGINDAYKHYKSTVGVFETLITLRDYISYIYNSGLVSNVFVCDRTNDIQSTYKVLTNANDVDTLVTEIDQDPIDDTNMLSAFDLKLYLLKLSQAELNSPEAYKNTFVPMNKAETANVEAYINDVKCISHDYSDLLLKTDNRSNVCLFKNKYPISCKIIPQYQLTTAAKKEVVEKVKTALYKNLNSAEVNFGEDIPTEFIYNTIMNADGRIKSIILDNISYTAYAVYCDNEDGVPEFYECVLNSKDSGTGGIQYTTNKNAKFDIKIDAATYMSKLWQTVGAGKYTSLSFICESTGTPGEVIWTLNGNTVTLGNYGITLVGKVQPGEYTVSPGDHIDVVISPSTQIWDEVYTKSVLAGTTQFFIQDETYNYQLDQIEEFAATSICSEVHNISSDLELTFGPNTEYKLRSNEFIQLSSPNLVTSDTYSTYVKFEYKLFNQLLDSVDYKLATDEYFALYWKEAQDSSYKYAIYGPGNIIKLEGFNLPASSGTNNYVGNILFPYCLDPNLGINLGTESDPAYYTDDEISNAMNSNLNDAIKGITDTSQILSTIKKIIVKRLNQITLTSADSYCYWILNEKVINTDGVEKFRLFDDEEDEYTLNSGEYFIYTDSSFTNLTILGAGTLLKRSNSNGVWEVAVKDISSITTEGINAFTREEWFIIPLNSSLYMTEQYYINVGVDSKFKLFLLKNRELYVDPSISGGDFIDDNDGKKTFLEKTSGYGEFTFSKLGGKWYYQDNEVTLADYGLEANSGSTSIVVTVPTWEILINSSGIYIGAEKINLKDFEIYYSQSGSEILNKVDTLDIGSGAYSWNAKTRLAINTSPTEEQILLENQSIKCGLGSIYACELDHTSSHQINIDDDVNFKIGDSYYKVTAATGTLTTDFDEGQPFDIEYFTYDINDEKLYFNDVEFKGDLVPLITAPVEFNELVNEYIIEGANLDSSGYPVAIYSSFDLITDGGQTISTYRYDIYGNVIYLGFYIHKKLITRDVGIYYSTDNKVEFTFMPGDTEKSIEFALPAGKYILSMFIGSNDLAETTDGVQVKLNGNSVHSMGSESETKFKESKKYFLYINLEEDRSNTLKLTIPSDTITRSYIVSLGDIYKYYYPTWLEQLTVDKILQLIRLYDKNNMFNYTHVVEEGDEIKYPLKGESFFMPNHAFNKYIIPQIDTDALSVSVANKR